VRGLRRTCVLPIHDDDLSGVGHVGGGRQAVLAQLVSNESANDAAAATLIGRALVGALADRVDHAFFAGYLPAASTSMPSRRSRESARRHR
jgi:hypothetical protein